MEVPLASSEKTFELPRANNDALIVIIKAESSGSLPNNYPQKLINTK